MTILAIDPGTTQSAWCVLEGGKPLSWAKEPNGDVLKMLRGYGADGTLLAVEMVQSFGMSVGREVFDTVRWVGRFEEAWDQKGGKSVLVYRRDVKLFLCETVRANDSNIRTAIIDRFGGSKEVAVGRKAQRGPLFGLSGDCWSALAVALTADRKPTPAPLFREEAQPEPSAANDPRPGVPW